MEPIRIFPHTPLADLMAVSPSVAPLFAGLHVDCGRCSMNKFCTLEDLCRHYGLGLAEVSAALEQVNAGFPDVSCRSGSGSPKQSPESPKDGTAW